MKYIVAAIFAGLLLAGCAHLNNAAPLIQCADAATTKVANQIVTQVETDLASANWTFALAADAKQFGEAAIWCILDYMATGVDAGAHQQQADPLMREQARQWVAAHPR